MMKNYSEDELKKMTNEELLRELSEHEWLHRDLLHEYDARNYDGRIPRGKPIPLDKLGEYIHNKYAEKRRKKAS